ncbi:hypothetical protein ACLK19_13850 [Escherichia coli]
MPANPMGVGLNTIYVHLKPPQSGNLGAYSLEPRHPAGNGLNTDSGNVIGANPRHAERWNCSSLHAAHTRYT